MLVKIKGNENIDVVFLSEANSGFYFNVVIILINYYGDLMLAFYFILCFILL